MIRIFSFSTVPTIPMMLRVPISRANTVCSACICAFFTSISKAEEAFDAENRAAEDGRRFYLVGYTVCQYYLDKYMISSLKDHRGKSVKVDLLYSSGQSRHLIYILNLPVYHCPFRMLFFFNGNDPTFELERKHSLFAYFEFFQLLTNAF